MFTSLLIFMNILYLSVLLLMLSETMFRTTGLKLLGKVPQANDTCSKKHADLINWILTISIYAIHNSSVYHRLHSQTIPPEAISGSTDKSHLYLDSSAQYYFPFDWCLGEALAKVENNQLVFTV